MKKIFTLALSAFMLGGVSLFAQEEDVTHYIINAGFDEDLTFQKDGTMKEAVSTTTSLSDRSWAYIAEDSTVYARPKETSGQSRPDGRKLEAVNGFKGRVKGWTMESNAEFPKCEWTYFGTVPYDLAKESVPIADDGSTYLEVPARPTEFDGGEGFVYLRAGWTNSAAYKQVVNLPCAKYRLEYWTININPNTSAVAKDLTQIVCRKDVFKDEESTGLQNQEWTKHSFEFTPTAEFTMQFGYEAANAGSGGQPIVALDGIKLYKIGEADEEELLRSDIGDLVDSLANIMEEDMISGYEGLVMEIGDVINEAEDASSIEEWRAKEKEIKAFIQKIQDLKADIADYEDMLATATLLVEAPEEEQYEAYDAFVSAVESIQDDVQKATSDNIADYTKKLQEALNNYYLSQKADANNPADYTFLIQTPYFTTAKAAPSITRNADGSIASVTYPNEADYTAGSAPADGNSEGWYVAGTTAGDQRLNYVQGRVCWNAWRQNAEDVAVATDLTNLPNGYYTVSAEMITQADYVSNQHLYAKSNLGSAVSSNISGGNWNDDNTGYWDYLTTEKVLVNDGKLTIGAIGSAIEGSTNQTGWFCVTNFRLQYYGEASAEEIAAATEARYAEADALAESMHLAADKADVIEAIAAAKAIANLDSLNAAIALAETSEAEYNGVITGTYAALQDSVANNANYSAEAGKLVKVPVDYMTNYLGSAEATYKNTGAITTILRYYRDTLIPALQSAEATKAAISAENGKAVIDGTIASVVNALSTYTDSTAYLDEQVAALKKAINLAEMADITIADGTDVTAYITNPTVDDGSANGWTKVKLVGDGNGAKSGQQYDGASGYYMDTWDPTAGKLRATWYQVLNVPNGTYTIKNIMRAAGTGAYLFASDKAPIPTEEENGEALDPTANNVLAAATNVETNVTAYTGIQAAEGGDSINVAADIYGELWKNAVDQLIAEGVALTLGNPDYTLTDQIEDLKADTYVPTAEQEVLISIIEANGGAGRGWFNNSIASFEVTNHVLVIGVTCDYAFVNKTEEDAFTGSWFSADNFTLTLDKAGNNDGWDPTTAIAGVQSATDAPAAAIYSISGARLNGLQKGINIVKMADGQVKKVLVK